MLDVSDTDAIASLAAELGQTDIVISNAIAPLVRDRPQTDQADDFSSSPTAQPTQYCGC